MQENDPTAAIAPYVPHSQMVREFMVEFNQEILPYPQFPDEKVIELRDNLIEEEYIREYRFAVENRDIVGVADALGDMLYVIHGAALAFGIDIEPVMLEIQRSNMSKQGGTYRESDGKYIKPDTYSPADIASIIDAQILKGVEIEQGISGIMHALLQDIPDNKVHIAETVAKGEPI